ncbi:helix-turn-helix domain-containing protein [Nitratireductor sp. OM-1]|uniref:helix-turn-helix domain-containing protein n=1 Tax=Nitratireductor sp. OM-1 TaxID=1756988 RepID=UPI0013AEC93D
MHEHTTTWDRHAILAEIKRRFGSSRAFARHVDLTASEISAALGSPYPKAERAIASALKVPVQTLWPDRYWPNGRRRSGCTRPQLTGASQKHQPHVDKRELL